MLLRFMGLQMEKNSEGVGNIWKRMGSRQKKLKAQQYKTDSCKSR
jgi:hypothetical protein